MVLTDIMRNLGLPQTVLACELIFFLQINRCEVEGKLHEWVATACNSQAYQTIPWETYHGSVR